MAAARDLVEWATRKTASNAAATMALSYVLGGSTGFNIRKEEAEANLWAFLRDSFVSSMTGGPFGPILRSTQGRGDALDAVAPIAVIREVADAFSGSGKYLDADTGETLAKLAGRFVPISQAIRTGPIGQTEADRIEVAERAYFRWRRTAIPGRGMGQPAPDARRAEVKRLVAAIVQGDEEEADRAWTAAERMHRPGQAPVAQLVRHRLLLRGDGPKEQRTLAPLLPQLRERIGDDAYALLEERDQRVLDYLKRRAESVTNER
jgi:hypothetical protein